MASKDTILISDKWIELKELSFPSGVSADDISKLMEIRPIVVSLEVSLPKGTSSKVFDYNKNADIRKFKANLDAKVSKGLADIANEDEPAEGKKTLEEINSYLEKAVKAFRLILRTAVAKAIGGTCKADDLMTAGSIFFEKIEFHFDALNSQENKTPLLDLTKAFKRLKKDQQLGVAWKANEIVVSVRFRKVFKQAELKELRDLLPEGASRGAKMLAGKFFAMAKGKVELRFEPNKKLPKEILLRKAFKEQSGQAVHITVTTQSPEDIAMDANKEKANNKGKAKSKI